MLKFFLISLFISLFSSSSFASGYNVYGLGVFDIKLDEGDSNPILDLRYERRFDNSLVNIGPESDNFFYLKPFVGIEVTSDSASYFIGGIYLEDNLGTLISGEESKINITPSFGIGYYDYGSGENLGHNLEFRTTLEISYELESKNRIGLSFGHISNANIGDKNPGVEILGLSYQVPF